MLGRFGGAGFAATMHNFGQRGFPAILVFLMIIVEFAGSLGLILGLLSRIAAFAIAVDMTVPAITVTSKFGMLINWPVNRKGREWNSSF